MPCAAIHHASGENALGFGDGDIVIESGRLIFFAFLSVMDIFYFSIVNGPFPSGAGAIK